MQPDLKARADLPIIILFFAALALIGAAGGAFIAHDYARARASLGWPSVEGIVLSQLDGERAAVRYVYSVEGRSYESTRTGGFISRFMKREKRAYQPGEDVIVYVNPQDHAYSVLTPGGPGAVFVFFCLLCGASLFFGAGGLVYVFSPRGEVSRALPAE
ncbi:MAG: DUF3592 domain-containing protein [Parvularculaceae bacterium]